MEELDKYSDKLKDLISIVLLSWHDENAKVISTFNDRIEENIKSVGKNYLDIKKAIELIDGNYNSSSWDNIISSFESRS